MSEKIHLAIIAMGHYEDYKETIVFSSKDEVKVQLWVDRFNKIIADNKDRMAKFVFEDDYIHEPLWYWEILYESPSAKTKEVELR